MNPLSNFLKMCNLCIAITINLALPMSRLSLEVVGISKHLVWCQNLGKSDEMYHESTFQFSKNVQFVYYNYHKFILPMSR